MDYVLYFMIYSFIGWCLEVAVALWKNKHFVNRGFLIGPYCPIYGFSCMFMLLFLNKYQQDPITLFIMAMVICGILEYITSYLMEKLFNARWWDYSTKKFNINGRICLETLIPFGILGCLFFYGIHPFVSNVVSLIPDQIELILTTILLTIFVIDNCVTFKIMFNLKKEFNRCRKDYTEKINRKVKAILEKRSGWYRRVFHAFPNVRIMLKKKK